MIHIAIIQFPGLNTEYETRREIGRAGMRGEFFRWNDDLEKLRKFDGYVIGGGFSYEDRGRAGIIAALDPLMEVLKEETEKGKPLLGICNGCQIAVESGLAPGEEHGKLCFGMGRNKRMKDGEVLGTGYYNEWVYLKNITPKGRTAFTKFIEDGEILNMPMAHGEGKFTTTIQGLLDKLTKNKQVVFRYVDKNGEATNEFPVNPNGSLWNIAAISNPGGNILAIMPHFERSEESQTFFLSMKAYIEEGKPKWDKAHKLNIPLKEILPENFYSPSANAIQMFIDLKITDNEADTFENTVKRLGFQHVSVKRQTHYEVTLKSRHGIGHLPQRIVQTGLLLNTNKERVHTAIKPKEIPPHTSTFSLLVREKQDFVGMQKTQNLRHRFDMKEITDIKKGTLWHVTVDTKSEKEKERVFKKLMQSHLFANPHIQEVLLWK